MSELTHLNSSGDAKMVDVGEKEITRREAVATGRVMMKPETLRQIRSAGLKKGDVLAVARVAGIMAAKKTPDLIPLCHPIPVDEIAVDFDLSADDSVGITATARCSGRTGVEMEAMVAASVAALTIYDMAKSIDRGMTITEIRLESKKGGKSGVYKRG
jgi:cyclic pyranopterin phosphate synthase